jgi:hypothetical protein
VPICDTNRELLDYMGALGRLADDRADVSLNNADSPYLDYINTGSGEVPRFTGEFWTSRQRKASSIHEISYRACFKPQLPRFFIETLSGLEDMIYDPFSGRGTTVIEAGLLGRRCVANDANPLSSILTRPRFSPPMPGEVRDRLAMIPFQSGTDADIDLSMFFHQKTEAEIVALKMYMMERREAGTYDRVDAWIRMVATNRLTGHSKGFFSVYTLPPNQAVSRESQRKINKKRNQSPDYRDVGMIILKKTSSLLRTLSPADRENLARAGKTAQFLSGDARDTPAIADASIRLTVTSPPFLDVVQYPKDNWLRCWFNDIDDQAVGRTITLARTLAEWIRVMKGVFDELYRVTTSGGFVAFEVGEVRKGSVRLEDAVLPLGMDSGFQPVCILINRQQFTKTAHIWGVGNNTGGTNTNRIVLFRKVEE